MSPGRPLVPKQIPHSKEYVCRFCNHKVQRLVSLGLPTYNHCPKRKNGLPCSFRYVRTIYTTVYK